jgi:hypothetical protein
MTLNLNDNIGKCQFFKWREALWLPRWKFYGIPFNQEIVKNIEHTALKMDRIRVMFGQPITVTSWWRPEPYNELIKGAKNSSHIYGMGCDFLVKGHDSDSVREILKKHLLNLNIRMEKLNTVHVHIDTRCDDKMSNDERYFKP